MKQVVHEIMLKAYERALEHSAKTNAKIDAQKPDLMKQASEKIDAMLSPLFT